MPEIDLSVSEYCRADHVPGRECDVLCEASWSVYTEKREWVIRVSHWVYSSEEPLPHRHKGLNWAEDLKELKALEKWYAGAKCEKMDMRGLKESKFTFFTPEECITQLEFLRSKGFRIPEEAFLKLREEVGR